MAVKYSVAKLNVKLNGKSYEKVYAHAQVNETTSLKKFAVDCFTDHRVESGCERSAHQ